MNSSLWLGGCKLLRGQAATWEHEAGQGKETRKGTTLLAPRDGWSQPDSDSAASMCTRRLHVASQSDPSGKAQHLKVHMKSDLIVLD